MTKIKTDLYQEVTNKIIEKLEQGVAPWKCTWSKYGLARNYHTGNIYNGINMLLLNCTANPIPYYLTFKQAKLQGGKIKKGAKSLPVFYYNVLFKDDNDKTISSEQAQSLKSNDENVNVNSFLKYYNVFNIDDIEGIDINIPDVELNNNPKIDHCEGIIKNMKNAPELTFVDANRAYYSPSLDVINMPSIEQFISSAGYYATYFHELVHSTGHTSRLAREGITKPVKFGDTTYSKEELIAEMGASFLCAQTNINYDNVTENSAAYIQGWLKVLKADKKLIFKAAAEASKAVNLITNYV